MEVEEEEECDEFPFNLSDFVTVDEVGDVTDLPSSPPPTVPMETTEERQDAPSSVQQDAPEDTPMEVTTETGTSDAKVDLVKSDKHVPESEPVTVPTAETSDGLVSSDLTPDQIPTCSAASPTPAPQPDASPSQTHAPTCQPEAPETETTPTATVDPTTEVEPLPTPEPAASAVPAESCSNSPEPGVVTAESEEEEKSDGAASHSQAKEEETVVVSDKAEEHNMQDEEDKETGAAAVESRKPEISEDQTSTKEESVKENLKSSDNSLPPFDPSSPVGMEFLVPKTGFFCKVCNRFFSGTKEAEISHCKTLKHYENLQKYLQTTKMANVTTKPDSS